MSKVFVETARGGVAADDGGEGSETPVVLVHGAAARGAQWAGQLDHLRRSRRAVAIDLPGHGISDPPRDVDWSVEAMAEAVWAVCDALGLRRLALVGHSYGGAVVAACAAGRADRVAGLAFVDSAPWEPGAAELDELRRGFRPLAYDATMERWFDALLVGAAPSTREAVTRDMRAMPRVNYMALQYGSIGFDLAAAAARFAGPRLAVCAEALGLGARWAPPVEVRVVRGVSHWLQLDDPAALNAALDGFLAKLG
jgi:pimeloyl-ACP methyl ester carboxylesterase